VQQVTRSTIEARVCLFSARKHKTSSAGHELRSRHVGWDGWQQRSEKRPRNACARLRRGTGAYGVRGAAVRGVGALTPRPEPRPRMACGRLRRGGGTRCVRGAAVSGVGAQARFAFAGPLVATARSQRWTPIIPAAAWHDRIPSSSYGFSFNYF